jgi:hypothetical protein
VADANIPPRSQPDDWNTAFAALPLERAPADAWARLADLLPQPSAPPAASGARPANRRRRLHVGFAAAASVAFALPMAWWLGTSTEAPTRAPSALAADTGAPVPTPSAQHDPAPAAAAAAHATPTPAVTRRAEHLVKPIPSPRAARERSAASTRTPADSGDAGSRTATGLDTRVAAVSSQTAMSEPGSGAGPVSPPATAPTSTDASRLSELRRESARLEALVAYARDDRMASAPVAVMSASIDDRIRLIDSALMQPDLDDGQRSSLWSDRVGALQELASLEGTQRWMAAHGASMDAVARVD